MSILIPSPPLVDAVAGTGSLRTLGTGSQQAAAGNDSRIPGSAFPSQGGNAGKFLTTNGSALSWGSPDTDKFGPFSSIPSPGNAGAQYIANDAPTAIWVDDGTQWRPIVNGQVVGTSPPAAAGWGWVNQGSAAISDRNGALHFSLPTSSGTGNIRFATRSLGGEVGTAHAEAICDFTPIATNGNSSQWSVVLYNSVTGNLCSVSCRAIGSGGGQWIVHFGYWASPSAISADGGDVSCFVTPARPLALQLIGDGTAVRGYFSCDLQNWTNFAGALLSTVFGSHNPNYAGIGSISAANIDAAEFDLMSFTYGS